MSQKSLLSKLARKAWREPTRIFRLWLTLWRGRIRVWLKAWWAKEDFADCGNEFESHGVTVSILLPSRKRREMLIKGLKNIAKTCGDYHQQVEVLVRLDDDDAESIAAQNEFHAAAAPVNLKIIVGSRWEGYLSFEKFVNELSAAACGDFLLLYNDDAEFLSDNWPMFIEKWRSRLVVLKFNTVPDMTLNIFPAMHRKIFEILGHYSLDTHCDSWISEVAQRLFIEKVDLDVKVGHLRDTEDDVHDSTFQETSSAYAVTAKRFWTKLNLIDKDSIILAKHILRHGHSLKITQEQKT